VNQTLGIQNMKQLSIQDKHPELVELIETFFKEAGVVLIKDALEPLCPL
jgi:cupin superfamily acireductone dioxygenase involved in methionine salvage